jgi:DIS3-like exonuclease 2
VFAKDLDPDTKEWKIPQEEIAKRLDLRDRRIFTIDPITAKDLDDALSVEKISDKIYEIGVHIADVSYFVQQGSDLDKEAQKRATSTYFVHKVYPMLPRLLCERLCSLNPNVDRLTYSIFFRMDISTGEVVKDFQPNI